MPVNLDDFALNRHLRPGAALDDPDISFEDVMFEDVW
jgi:hypothetical protein